MSGLFLNFYQIDVEIPNEKMDFNAVNYYDYSTKDKIAELKQKYPDNYIYKIDNKFVVWNNNDKEVKGLDSITINLQDNIRLVSKIIENSIIEFLKNSLEKKGWSFFKKKFEFVWEIVSPDNILNNTIPGFSVNRVIKYSPYFFYKDSKLFLGFTLSTYLRHRFKWNKKEFEENGIDTNGLKRNDSEIFANSHSIKLFLEATGKKEIYQKSNLNEISNANSFKYMNVFFDWLRKKKERIVLPFGGKNNFFQKTLFTF